MIVMKNVHFYVTSSNFPTLDEYYCDRYVSYYFFVLSTGYL